MKYTWFRPLGWGYIPVHPFGFIITAIAIVFMIPICSAIIRNGHSVTDDLYQIFIYGSCTIFWWKWIAEKTTQKNDNTKNG